MNAKPALIQLAEDKRALESRIRDLIGKEVAAFTEDTGVGVKSIEIRMLHLQHLDKPASRTVCGATVSLDLE